MTGLPPYRVCIAGEERGAESLREALANHGDTSFCAQAELAEVPRMVAEHACDCVVLVASRARDARDILTALGATQLSPAVVVITPVWDPTEAAEMLEAGSDCCLPLDGANGDLLTAAIGRALEQRQLPAALEASERRLAEAQRVAQIGSWEWDVAKDHIVWSRELYRLADLSPEEFEPTWDGFFSSIHPDDRKTGEQAAKRSLETGEDLAFKYRIVRSDGEVRWMQSHGEVVLAEQGTPIQMRGTVQDITAQEHELELEQQLQRVQGLEAIGQLAGGIAHDFNNLLAVILNYASFLREELADRPELERELEEIEAAAARGAELTRQLLLFGSREAPKAEPIDVERAFAETEALLQRTLGEHILLDTRVSPGLTVRLAPGQLDQVLINLALNARDAMPEGGTLTIEAGQVEDEAPGIDLSAGSFVRITVTDTGAGMEEEVAQRALDPFFTTKPSGKGTGLGLATVSGIVQRASGDVRLRSHPGIGTTVQVMLPADARAEPPPADTKRALEGHRRDGGSR